MKKTRKKQITGFCNKIRQDSGKTILLKNPAHSLRIPLLREVFPNARFIYIHRHPYKVIASSLHLWKVLARDNQLKGNPYFPNLKEVTNGLVRFYEVIESELAKLPPDKYFKVSYEELESEPVQEIKVIYKAFNLEFTVDFENRIRLFLAKEKDFRKNSYSFDDEQKAQVVQLMKKQFEQYHYKP